MDRIEMLIEADKRGLLSPDKKVMLDEAVKRGLVSKADMIPGQTAAEIPPKAPDPNFLEKLGGAGEAALSMGSGIVGGLVGNIAGVGKSLTGGKFGTAAGANEGQQVANDVSRAMTYQPRTQAGRDIIGTVGDVMDATKIAGLNPFQAAELAAVSGPVASAAAQGVTKGTAKVSGTVGDLVRKPEPAMQGMGAATTEQEAIRRARAQNLPVPIKLSKGEATRDFEQQRFEKETMKDSSAGEPLRQHAADNVQKVIQNFESWIDQTGAEAPDLISVGKAVDRPLVRKMESAKAEIRDAYNKAENAGHMAEPIDTRPLVDYLERNQSAAELAPVISAAQRELVRLGGASKAAPMPSTAAITAPQQTVTQAIRSLGGINSADMRDIVGESRAGINRSGIPVALFRKDGPGLDDLATRLKAKGYDIDMSDVDGGVQQLRDMIRDENSGRAKHYPVGSEHRVGKAVVDERDIEDIAKEHSKASSDLAAQYDFDAQNPDFIKAQQSLNAQRDAKIQSMQRAQNAPAQPIVSGSSVMPGKLPINDMENLRKLVVRLSKKDETNGHFGGEINQVIDQMTEGKGGDLYKQARTMFKGYAAEFKNTGAIRKLVSTKPGTTDRTVALEDVFDHAVLRGSNQDTSNIIRSLEGAGPEGLQAIKELKGQTINWLLGKTTENASRDIRGQPIPSFSKIDKAVRALDQDGKLDLLFGKQQAAQIRDLKELIADIHTAPPGAVNTSTSAAVIMEAMGDIATGRIKSGGSKVIAGIKQAVGDRDKLKRVRDALKDPDEAAPIVGAGNNTLH